ncbi:response regulator [Allosalinactinospora lopnorensis]|uniref:response regulator n=1 Tax=Allosalinactinospora lopnorensis TaxID=1352348 RepID=UPI000623F6C5|nr:response regulator transcription factor [Allosalinactinospora lopnorensis]
MIRILVVDDHSVVREGIVALLSVEDDIEVVGQAGDGTAAVSAASALAPDVVLMDLRMPGENGIEATRRIVAANPECNVIVLTTYDEDEDIVGAIEAGAIGYLLKNTSLEELTAAVRAGAAGRSVMTPAVAQKLARRRSSPPAPLLTQRELQILDLVAQGYTNARIGRRLGISESTVKSHLLNIFGKLGVSDRTGATTAALSRGLIRLPER